MIPRLLVVFALLGAGLLAGACGGESGAEPPEIRYGEDVCDRCGMIISEARFAAAYVTEEGEARRFDDIGDLLAFDAERGEEVAAYWAHDYETAEWVRAEEAWYVRAESIDTPMGHGIVAFAERARAEAKAAETGGEVLGWPALLALGTGGENGMSGDMSGMTGGASGSEGGGPAGSSGELAATTASPAG